MYDTHFIPNIICGIYIYLIIIVIIIIIKKRSAMEDWRVRFTRYQSKALDPRKRTEMENSRRQKDSKQLRPT